MRRERKEIINKNNCNVAIEAIRELRKKSTSYNDFLDAVGTAMVKLTGCTFGSSLAVRLPLVGAQQRLIEMKHNAFLDSEMRKKENISVELCRLLSGLKKILEPWVPLEVKNEKH